MFTCDVCGCDFGETVRCPDCRAFIPRVRDAIDRKRKPDDRMYIASHAMQALIGTFENINCIHGPSLAEQAVGFADALLIELGRGNESTKS